MSDMAGLRIPKLPPTIVGTPSLAPNIHLSNPVVSGLKSMYKVGLCSRFNKNLTNRCAAEPIDAPRRGASIGHVFII